MILLYLGGLAGNPEFIIVVTVTVTVIVTKSR